MDTIILAGGKGRRLGSDVPKPLVEVAGKPALDYLLERIERFHQHAIVFPGTTYLTVREEHVPAFEKYLDDGNHYGFTLVP